MTFFQPSWAGMIGLLVAVIAVASLSRESLKTMLTATVLTAAIGGFGILFFPDPWTGLKMAAVGTTIAVIIFKPEMRSIGGLVLMLQSSMNIVFLAKFPGQNWPVAVLVNVIFLIGLIFGFLCLLPQKATDKEE